MNEYKCKFCGRIAKSHKGNYIHQSRCNKNPNKIYIRPWNKGLVDSERTKLSESTKLKMKNAATGRASTQEKEKERRNKISETAKRNKRSGGYRIGSGRSKSGWFKNIFCDSSWEFAFLIYHIDNNIAISRCKDVRFYEFNGKTKKYFPDFLVSGKIFEIKGFKTEQSLAKEKANPDITIIGPKEIQKYIDFVVNKYGKDFTRLYENGKTTV